MPLASPGLLGSPLGMAGRVSPLVQPRDSPPWGRNRSPEGPGLASEVLRLREELSCERAETDAAAQQFTRKIEALTSENRRLQEHLVGAHARESLQDSEAMVVKREVLEKTAAIEQAMRELQAQQQVAVGRVKGLVNVMLATCAGQQDEAGRAGPGLAEASGHAALGAAAGPLSGGFGTRPTRSSAASVASGRAGGGRAGEAHLRRPAVQVVPGPAGGLAVRQPERAGEGSPDSAETQMWFQSVKSNLERYGSVEVFVDSTVMDCACCLENLASVYRIRPRQCGHVFHIECLLQSWTEGSCPVCGASFAPQPAMLSGQQTERTSVSMGERR